ncbi:hypothetical protein PX52LOC_04491 [Limnoglobus roseus]|uniref:IS5/IS1182 family transposase n=2 Tax=Limnoglobus roseus TaxID=2598579 RepID=A0A5C1AIJ1_9BACT|nr:hypothetical protein PX52LOC_04491 [Limnoglobus roseus]
MACQEQLPGVGARQRMKARVGTEGYRLRPKCRMRIEEGFGWLKRVTGLAAAGWWEFQPLLGIGAAAYNLVRSRTLRPVAGVIE